MATHAWSGPRRSVESLVSRLGHDAVAKACIDLVAGRDVDGAVVHALGGPPARWAVDGGAPGPDYWLRVWGLRGLLWSWDDTATAVVVDATRDEAWRVREMAAKVAARHGVDEALEAMLDLQHDPVARVRSAAARAVARISGRT